MEKEAKFLEFNGKALVFINENGQYYVAVKPICEALGVNFRAQRRQIMEDPVLSQLRAHEPAVAQDGKVRKMLCLPERYVYGWLFSINSNSPELLQYKYKCYDLLYDHFHGAFRMRLDAVQDKSRTRIEIEELEEKLKETAEYRKLMELKQKMKSISGKLQHLDQKLMQQPTLFDN